MADGAALFFLWTQASGYRAVQPAAEAGLHVVHWVWGTVAVDGDRVVQADTVFVAGISIRRIPSHTHLALRCAVRIPSVYSRPPDHGSAAWLGEFLLHAFRMEARAGVSGVGNQSAGNSSSNSLRNSC